MSSSSSTAAAAPMGSGSGRASVTLLGALPKAPASNKQTGPLGLRFISSSFQVRVFKIIPPVTSGRGRMQELFASTGPSAAGPAGRELRPARKRGGKQQSGGQETREARSQQRGGSQAATLRVRYSRAWHQHAGLSPRITRTGGEEDAQHYLRQVTKPAAHDFRSCKAEVGGLGLGFGQVFVRFVDFSPPSDNSRLTAFYSQETQRSPRLEAVQPR